MPFGVTSRPHYIDWSHPEKLRERLFASHTPKQLVIECLNENKDKFFDFLLHAHSKKTNTSFIAELIQNQEIDLIDELSKSYDKDKFKLLLDSVNNLDETALHWACSKNSVNFLTWLYNYDAKLFEEYCRKDSAIAIKMLFVKKHMRSIETLYELVGAPLFLELITTPSQETPFESLFSQCPELLTQLYKQYPDIVVKAMTPTCFERAIRSGCFWILEDAANFLPEPVMRRCLSEAFPVITKKGENYHSCLVCSLVAGTGDKFLKFVNSRYPGLLSDMVENFIKNPSFFCLGIIANLQGFEPIVFLEKALPKSQFRALLVACGSRLIQTLLSKQGSTRYLSTLRWKYPDEFDQLLKNSTSNPFVDVARYRLHFYFEPLTNLDPTYYFGVLESLDDTIILEMWAHLAEGYEKNSRKHLLKPYLAVITNALIRNPPVCVPLCLKQNSCLLELLSQTSPNLFTDLLYTKIPENDNRRLIDCLDENLRSQYSQQYPEPIALKPTSPQSDPVLETQPAARPARMRSSPTQQTFKLSIGNMMRKHWLEGALAHEIRRLMCLEKGVWGINLSNIDTTEQLNKVISVFGGAKYLQTFKQGKEEALECITNAIRFFKVRSHPADLDTLQSELQQLFPHAQSFVEAVMEGIRENTEIASDPGNFPLEGQPYERVTELILSTKIQEYKKQCQMQPEVPPAVVAEDLPCFLITDSETGSRVYPCIAAFDEKDSLESLSPDTHQDALKLLTKLASDISPAFDDHGGLPLSKYDLNALCSAHNHETASFHLFAASGCTLEKKEKPKTKKRSREEFEEATGFTITPVSNKRDEIRPISKYRKISFNQAQGVSSSSLSGEERQQRLNTRECLWRQASAATINRINTKLHAEQVDWREVPDLLRHKIANKIKNISFSKQNLVWHNTRLKTYQKGDAEWLLALHEAGIGGILASPTGTGKTFISLETVFQAFDKQLDGPRTALLIVPNSIVPQWEKVLVTLLVEAKLNYFRRAFAHGEDVTEEFHEFAFQYFKEGFAIAAIKQDTALKNYFIRTLQEGCYKPELHAKLKMLFGKLIASEKRRYKKLCSVIAQALERPILPKAIGTTKSDWIAKINPFDAYTNLDWPALKADKLKKRLEQPAHFVIATASKMQADSGKSFMEVFESTKWISILLDEAQKYHDNQKGDKLTYRFLASFLAKLCNQPDRPLTILNSGTPFETNEDDVWSLLKIINPKQFSKKRLEALNNQEQDLFKIINSSKSDDDLYQSFIRFCADYEGAKRYIEALIKIHKRTDHDLKEQWAGQGMPEPNYHSEEYELTNEQETALLQYNLGVQDRWQVRSTCLHPLLNDSDAAEKLKCAKRLLNNGLYAEAIAKLELHRAPQIQKLMDVGSSMERAIQNKEPTILFVETIQEGKLLQTTIRSLFAEDKPEVAFYYATRKNKSKNNRMIESFKTPSNHARILIQTYKSGGTGFDFPEAKNIFNLTSLYNPSDLEQLETRHMRVGSPHETVNIYRVTVQSLHTRHLQAILEKKSKRAERFLSPVTTHTREALTTLIATWCDAIEAHLLSAPKRIRNLNQQADYKTQLQSLFQKIKDRAAADLALPEYFKQADPLPCEEQAMPALAPETPSEPLLVPEKTLEPAPIPATPPSPPHPRTFDLFWNETRFKLLPVPKDDSMVRALHCGILLANDEKRPSDWSARYSRIYKMLKEHPEYADEYQNSSASDDAEFLKFKQLLIKLQPKTWKENSKHAKAYCKKSGYPIRIFTADESGQLALYKTYKPDSKSQRTIHLLRTKHNGEKRYDLLLMRQS